MKLKYEMLFGAPLSTKYQGASGPGPSGPLVNTALQSVFVDFNLYL